MGRLSGKKINQIRNPEKYKVGIYVRTGKKLKGIDTIKFQKDRVEEYCNDMNLKIANLYIDDGVDLFTENRPSYYKMINDIKEGKVNMIVTANLARIARSNQEMQELLKLQEKYNFRTVFTDSREELLEDKTMKINIEDYLTEEGEIEEFDEDSEEDEGLEME